jgi:hypothetical protein
LTDERDKKIILKTSTMARIIKKMPVTDKDAALSITTKLAEKYGLKATDPENALDVSNEKMHVYYVSEEDNVVVETNDLHSGEEYVKELLASFPTFF